MNTHLQLFKFFNESEESNYIEKNLTRAFALCLKNEPVFLYEFLRTILLPDDLQYILTNPPEEGRVDIDIEIETKTLVENTKKLYALGVTEDSNNELWNIDINAIQEINKSNYTDISIVIKDITIIIEAKRTAADCRMQLAQQILPFHFKNVEIQKMHHLSWLKIMTLIKNIFHFNILNNTQNSFTYSFLQLIERRFNHWVPTSPFKHLAFEEGNEVNALDRNKRLEKAMYSLGEKTIASFFDRKAIIMDRAWATEAIPEFSMENGIPYLVLNVWPGNTKQQGYYLYSHSMGWTNEQSLTVAGNKFDLEIFRHIKFMHFNRYITCIETSMNDSGQMKKEINSQDNFHNQSGRWDRNSWNELENFLSKHFNFDWKTFCKWSESFQDTNRNYLTLALGYRIQLKIPYSYLQELDNNNDSFNNVGHFLKECVASIINLVEEN